MLQTVLIVIHLLLAVFLVGIILIQQSEGGGLGIGGGGGGGGFMTARGTANFLTRTTGILAGAFMVTSLALAIVASRGAPERKSILDVPAAPVEAPTQPSVPLAK
jgi:preprotein translocase subunit SecG